MEILVQDIARQRAVARTAVRRQDLILIMDSSRVIPKLIYTWAVHRLPDRVDAEWTAVAATRDSLSTILSSVEDWAWLARDWLPASASEAIVVCHEVVMTVGERRHPYAGPILYQNHESGDAKHLAPGTGDALKSVAAPPTAAGLANGGWLVLFWEVEGGRAAKYECAFGPEGVALQLRDSIPGIGTFRPGV